MARRRRAATGFFAIVRSILCEEFGESFVDSFLSFCQSTASRRPYSKRLDFCCSRFRFVPGTGDEQSLVTTTS
jgi:hypothetical protein